MISIDTFLLIVKDIVSLYVKKMQAPSSKKTMGSCIAWSFICLLLLLIFFTICSEATQFLQAVVSKIKSSSSILSETNFVSEDFLLLYLYGILPFVAVGMLLCYESIQLFLSTILKIICPLCNLLLTLFIPYLLSSVVYHFSNDLTFSAVIINLLVNFIASPLLIFLSLFFDWIDLLL